MSPSPLARSLATPPLALEGGECAHHLFEARAALDPDAVAASFAEHEVTYGELERRANALAARLQAHGVGPEVRVAVLMERGPELAAALLGILKAGGAYVPIDPVYPADRIAYVLADSGAAAVVTHAAARARLPQTDVRVVDVAEIRSARPGWAPPAVPGDALAYVIYTSGSTGRPKGVCVTHRSLVAHNHAAVALYGITARDRVGQVASVSFDISVEEIFPTWAAGATVVFRPPEVDRLGEGFLRWIEAERITILNLPTAYWDAWTAEMTGSGARVPRCVRLVVVGGERARRTTLDQWRRAAGETVRWFNTYGPTETTVTATAWEPEAEDDEGEVPIGMPIDGWTTRVLDERLVPVPEGSEGELCIGGVGVARGYLGRPGLTAERFVPDPLARNPGARMFRSGDRARARPDGAMEFLGRLDQQVKVRGFRVEPGEIEAALVAHPEIADAAVIAGADEEGHKRLAAYVVSRGGDVGGATLRRWLHERLPEYMVPSSITLLDALPLTPNGKVDRRALSAVDATPAPSPGGGDTAAVIAQIWSEVLGVRGVQRDDNFFDLGGHSLVAVQVLTRVRSRCGVELPWRALFDTPTPASLAAAVDAARGVDAAPRPPSRPIPTPREGSLTRSPTPPGPLHPGALRDALFNRVVGYLRDSISRLDDRGLLEAIEAPTPGNTIARVMAAAPDAGVERDPWTDALLRGAAIRDETLRLAGGLLSSGEVAALLGVSVAAVKQRQRRGNLLAVPLANGEWGYPARQLAESGKVRDGLPRLLTAFGGASPWLVLSFLVNPAPGGEGETGFDALSDPVATERLVEIARTYGEQGAA